jgi:hypothetical protein
LAAAASSFSHTSKKYLANDSREIGTELIRMRSRTAIRWGDVKRPTFRGVSCDVRYFDKIEFTKAQVEPLPFVPATWITLSLSKSRCLEGRSAAVGIGREKCVVLSSRVGRDTSSCHRLRSHLIWYLHLFVS